MTCFALGAKVGRGAAPVASARADRPSRSPPASDARAAMPTAFAPREKNWRRVSYRTQSWSWLIFRSSGRRASWGDARSTLRAALLIEDLVEVHQLVGEHGPGGEGGGFERRVGPGLSLGEEGPA